MDRTSSTRNAIMFSNGPRCNRRFRPVVLTQPLKLRVVRIRSLMQALALLALTMYTSLVVYRIISSLGDRLWRQERSSRMSESWGDYEALYALLPTASREALFIGVETSAAQHKRRLPVLLKTWFQLVRGNAWFFTDADDPEFAEKTKGHMVNTNCSASREIWNLCCGMWVAMDMFVESGKEWYCHVHDKMYVNVPRLLWLLGGRSPQEAWYLGKPSLQQPRRIVDGEVSRKAASFSFATRDAGFCLSRALALKMKPVAGMGKFAHFCEKLGATYDVTLGYLIEHVLNTSLTVIDQFHSDREPMKFIEVDTLYEHITFSYNDDENNVVDLDGFDKKNGSNEIFDYTLPSIPKLQLLPEVMNIHGLLQSNLGI